MQKDMSIVTIFFAVLFILSVVGSILSMESLTGQTVKQISYLNKGKMLRILVKNVPEVEFVDLVAEESIKLDEVKVLSDDALPSLNPYLSKFTISSTQPEKYDRVIVTFRISENELLDKGFDEEDLRLYHDGKQIPLTFYKFSGGYLYLNAETSKMGGFVLVTVKSS